jgi:hypothetical protein
MGILKKMKEVFGETESEKIQSIERARKAKWNNNEVQDRRQDPNCPVMHARLYGSGMTFGNITKDPYGHPTCKLCTRRFEEICI